MRLSNYLAAALIAAATFGGGSAFANSCQTPHLQCPTAMPVNGYCECTAHGASESGSVAPPQPGQHTNASTGGCGTAPNSPGCR